MISLVQTFNINIGTATNINSARITRSFIKFYSTNNFNRKVKIVEVGPRDGLQNEASADVNTLLSHEVKINLVKKLIKAGCHFIECGSFVSPKWVPAMGNSKEVFRGLHNWRTEGRSKNDGSIDENVVFSALTPNLQGFQDAMDIGKGAVNEVAIFGAASETFSRKNIGCSIEESIDRFQKVTDAAKEMDIPVRGYVSCVLGCPYEKHVNASKVAEVAERLLEMGCHEISLGDTIGVGTPFATIEMINEVKAVADADKLAVHFHDTYGQALANIYAALGEGINTIDSSVAGLGGCPYAAGASGNISTEDVVYMLNGMSIDSGIDLEKLVDAGDYICKELGKKSGSKFAQAFQKSCS